VEGPSGIGKTTAVINAIEEAGLNDKIIQLSARKQADIEVIKALPEQVPFSTVLVDDFHRLDIDTKRAIADLMKTLADEGASHSKLVVLGITNAGQSLIQFGKDLANRVEVIPFEANPEHKISELVSKGEAALNISFNIREEIIREAQGSFYLAQMLSYHTCLRSNILRTVTEHLVTKESYESVRSYVVSTLARSFHDTAVAFARGSKLRREGRAPYLHLLYWLSQSKNWYINCNREVDHHPEQRGSVSQVVSKGYLSDVIGSSEDIQRALHYDATSTLLIVQDPQFVFYIRNISWPRFAEEVGFISIEFPSRYDFAISFAGADRDIAEALFRELQEREFEVFYDKNEQHRILAEDVEEYLAPIYSSDAQLVICILGPEYPERVWTKFESAQFKERFKTGEVIPIVLSTAPLGVFDSASRVGHIKWDKSEDFGRQLQAAIDLLVAKCGELRKKTKEAAEQAARADGSAASG
jgi:hypothetical protein